MNLPDRIKRPVAALHFWSSLVVSHQSHGVILIICAGIYKQPESHTNEHLHNKLCAASKKIAVMNHPSYPWCHVWMQFAASQVRWLQWKGGRHIRHITRILGTMVVWNMKLIASKKFKIEENGWNKNLWKSRFHLPYYGNMVTYTFKAPLQIGSWVFQRYINK